MPKHVCLLLSGGIDSAVATYILQKQGYFVHALYLQMHASYSSDALHQAQEIASHFQIPFSVLDVKKSFNENVYSPLLKNYSKGITPNPCISCNPSIKFGDDVVSFSNQHDLAFIATGHYARIEQKTNKQYLCKATDVTKDQSYFMYRIPSTVYSRLLFPIGEYCKSEVREMSSQLGFRRDFFDKESNDLCFFNGTYREFASTHIQLTPGFIRRSNGEICGQHNGIGLYTVGQRQGLGVSADRPLYVAKINAEKNEIIVGYKEELFSRECTLHSFVWHGTDQEKQSTDLGVKVRYRSKEVTCTLHIQPDEIKVHFLEPIFAITPGQSAVFYIQDRLVGGGIIAS